MKKYLNSNYLLYFCFLIVLFMMLFIKNIHFEPINFGFIGQILHPEYPKGALLYNPIYHHDYIVATIVHQFGLNENLVSVARIFWFLEMGLAVLVLGKLVDFVFKGDKLIAVILIMPFLLSQSGQLDEKTMVMPIYLLAIYYFLKEKWFLAALFGAAIFYLHIGLAIWWLLPSFFALAVIYIWQRRITLKQIINYLVIVIGGAFPILYFYLGYVRAPALDTFLIKYYYYTCWYASSVILLLKNIGGIDWIQTMVLMVPILLVGYIKAKNSWHKKDNVASLLFGILMLFIVNFIFADLLGNSFIITLQLLRSVVFLEFFFHLFFAFLLARQINKGNYVFFLAFVLLAFKYNILRDFLGGISQQNALNIFYLIFLAQEIFEKQVYRLIEKTNKALGLRFLRYSSKVASQASQLLRQPVPIALFFVLLIIPSLPLTKYAARAILNLAPQPAVVWDPEQYLQEDMAKFVNQKMSGENILLLIPFDQTDFPYYIKHKTFITSFTAVSENNVRNSVFKTKNILKADLDYSPDKLFENYSDNNFREKWQDLWVSLDEGRIRSLKNKYKITHVIREKEFPLNFPVLYQNRFYKIYEIK